MSGSRILVVEDEAIIAMEIENSLQSLGYVVTSVVNNGNDAVKKVEEENPDLVLMDIRIQGDTDGIETAGIIKAKYGVPIVFSTAYLDKERIERAKITMPFGYVLKPIQEREFKVTLEMALYVSKVDAERKKLEDLFKRVFVQNPDPVVLYATDRSFKMLNRAWTRALGYEVSELEARPLVELMHPDDREKAIKKFHDPEHDIPFLCTHIRYRHKNGGYRTFETRSSPETGGAKFSTMRDITQQKEIERGLKASNDLYQSFFWKSNGCLILIDSKSQSIMDCNDNFLDLIGLSRDAIVGETEKNLLSSRFKLEEGHDNYKVYLSPNQKRVRVINNPSNTPLEVIIQREFEILS